MYSGFPSGQWPQPLNADSSPQTLLESAERWPLSQLSADLLNGSPQFRTLIGGLNEGPRPTALFAAVYRACQGDYASLSGIAVHWVDHRSGIVAVVSPFVLESEVAIR